MVRRDLGLFRLRGLSRLERLVEVLPTTRPADPVELPISAFGLHLAEAELSAAEGQRTAGDELRRRMSCSC